VLLARPTRSRNLLVQMIGRGMRLHPGKTNCHIIDMVASFGIGLVTTPTLFGLDPSEIVKDATVDMIKDLHERERRKEELEDEESMHSIMAPPVSRNRNSKLSFTHYESVHDLLDDTSGERHIRAISQYAWVQIGEDRFVLTTKDGKIEIFKDEREDLYRVMFTRVLPPGTKTKAPWYKPRKVADAITFADAVHAADTLAGEEFERIFLVSSAEWRRKPATDGQVAFLNKLRSADDQLTVDQITRGRAGDMITKVKFGARGWFEKQKLVERKVGKEQNRLEQLEDLKRREAVQVGPVAA